MIEEGGFADRAIMRTGMALRTIFYAVAIAVALLGIDFDIGDRRIADLTLSEVGKQIALAVLIGALVYKFFNPSPESAGEKWLRDEHWRFWGKYGLFVIAGLIAFIVFTVV